MSSRQTLATTLGLALAVGLLAAPVLAQGVDLETRVPAPDERRFEIRPPARDQVTRPEGADFYPEGPRVQHDPAFIEPFTVETETGRVGLSGWTAPNTPVGPEVGGRREINGWFALGLTFTWGGPPTPRRPAAAP